MYISTEVSEIDLSTNFSDSVGFFKQYRDYYIEIFDMYRSNFIYYKYIDRAKKLSSEINIF